MFFCAEVCHGDGTKTINKLLVFGYTYAEAIEAIDKMFENECVYSIKIEVVDSDVDGICDFAPEEWFKFE